MANRYADLHARIAANPAPVDDCIREVVSEIERFAAYRVREIEHGRKHPHWGAEKLYRLRSTLIYLQRLRDEQAAAGNNQEIAA
jgi:hypothetical protein